MNLLTYLMLSFLLGGGIYLLCSRKYTEVIIGVALLSNGVNLLLMESSQALPHGSVDPLPQALVLTAIVIGFALITFLCAYVYTQTERGMRCELCDYDEGEDT